jgi:hypothetical protein
MARTCSICCHPQRDAIDAELVKPVSLPVLATKYDGISAESLRRHRLNHLLPLLTEGHAADVSRAEALVAQMWGLQQDTLDALEWAREAGDLRLFFTGVREARGNAELLARLSGAMNADENATRQIKIVFDEPPPIASRPIEGEVRLIPESA